VPGQAQRMEVVVDYGVLNGTHDEIIKKNYQLQTMASYRPITSGAHTEWIITRETIVIPVIIAYVGMMETFLLTFNASPKLGCCRLRSSLCL
jgi:hypothetical protein